MNLSQRSACSSIDKQYIVQRRNTRSNPFLIAFYLLVTSVGIGWLTGRSVSSVILISVTGAAAAIVAALSRLEDKRDPLEIASKGQIFLSRWNISS